MRDRRDPITQLRNAIDCLPAETKAAMLDGIRSNPIIVGAYTDNRGGICPMLAAHRQGARHDHLPFARSWDAFARAGRVRKATQRELRVLEDLLEASLLASDDVDLKAAIADHEALKRVREEAVRAGRKWEAPKPDAGREFTDIVARRLKPGRVRALRDAERALGRLEAELVRIT